MRKKVALTAAAVAMVGTLAVGGTLAWFTDTETATNVVTMGNVDIQLEEDGSATEGEEPGKITGTGLEYEKIMPGDTLAKEVKVVAENDSAPAWVRVKIYCDTVTDAGNVVERLEFLLNGESIDATWTVEDDQAVAIIEAPTQFDAGDEWTIFDTIKIPESWGNDYEFNSFDVQIVAEAIQADHVAKEDAWNQFEAAGNVDSEKIDDASWSNADNN